MIRLYGKGLTVSQCLLRHSMATLLCVGTSRQLEYFKASFSKSPFQPDIIPAHDIGLHALIKTFKVINRSFLLLGFVLNTRLQYCLGDSGISTYQVRARYGNHGTCRLQ